MKRLGILVLLIASLLTTPAGAVALKKAHPQEYTIQHGDSLWSIANKFLTHPWDCLLYTSPSPRDS